MDNKTKCGSIKELVRIIKINLNSVLTYWKLFGNIRLKSGVGI